MNGRFVLAAVLSGLLPAGLTAGANSAKPNVVIVLADDMGFSDAHCYGGEIATPNLDFLARQGLRFTQFYNTARCWPTRAALLTGYYPQAVRRDTVPGVPSGGKGVRPLWAPLLPEMLRPLGYRSYHSGKWHLDGQPTANGFDRSYYLEDCGRYFQPRVHYEDDVRLPPPPAASGYYATSAIAEHAIGYLQEHARLRGAQPFFLYLCFTAPHFPLQALPQDIARYRYVYLRGWDQTRQARWQRMTATGLVRHALPPWERGVGPPYHFPEALRQLGASETNRPVAWAELSETQQRFQAAKMAVHAAMIDRMDRAIGLVLDQLRSMGAWENTLILFLSDNGASAELMVRDDGHDPAASPGSAATHLCLGPGWSTVANTPFRRHKTWVHEGGIATSFIAHWPSGIAARGELRHTPGHVIDLVPTILELAGGAPAKTWAGQPVPPAPGQSLVPLFRKDGTVRHAYFWWQHEGNRALRLGDWKLVAAGENAPWELYHLRTDRGETQNLASRQPARAAKLAAFWQRQFEEFHRLARSDLRTNAVTRDAAPPGN